MRSRFWPLVLSLMLGAAPALAKKHAENSSEKGSAKQSGPAASAEPSGTSSSTQSAFTAPSPDSGGGLDDLLNGKTAPPPPLPPIVSPPARTTPEPAVSPDSKTQAGEGPKESGSTETSSAPAPTKRTNLEGSIEENGLSTGAEATSGEAMQPKTAPQKKVLQGNASVNDAGLTGMVGKGDPDVYDHELMVEWDRWRNRFLMAVQMQIQAGVNHPDFDDHVPLRFDPKTGNALPRFALGTTTWFYCEITKDRKVKRLEVTKPSGNPIYDKLVLEGVRALEGTSILQFPQASKRLVVTQEAGIRTSETSNYQYHKFGDVEHYRSGQ